MASQAPLSATNEGRAFALVAPIVVVAAAYGLWWMSDRLLYVGGLDRAQFGWLVVIPVLLAAPVVAGFVWSGLAERQAIGVALVAGTAVGVTAAFLFWRSVADPGCGTAPRFTAADWIVPSLTLGALFGASVSISGLVAARFVRQGRRVSAVVAAVGIDVLLLGVVLVALGAMLITPMCERPIPVV